VWNDLFLLAQADRAEGEQEERQDAASAEHGFGAFRGLRS
jgi:hypothetical protein